MTKPSNTQFNFPPSRARSQPQRNFYLQHMFEKSSPQPHTEDRGHEALRQLSFSDTAVCAVSGCNSEGGVRLSKSKDPRRPANSSTDQTPNTFGLAPLCTIIETRQSRPISFWENLKLWVMSRPTTKDGPSRRGAYSAPRRVGDIHDLIVLSRSPVCLVNRSRVVPRDRIDLSLVREWLSACESNHSACQRISTARKAQNPAQPGFIFIDVNRKRLVHEPAASRYLALSYVWGGVKQLQLTQANRPTLEKDMSLSEHWKQIPQVIRDAISFVEEIGEKYLWVDTLCIVQDSESRHFEIGRMNEIYQNAVCTLVALDAKDATGSLYGFRSDTRALTPFAWYNDLLIRKKRPELSISFARSTYEQRAWTFQERLLSTRCPYFTREQLYFHCQTDLWSEDRYEHFEQHADLFGSYPSLAWPSQSSPSRNRADKLKAYTSLVTHYTRRQLSFQSDRLDAFSGIANSYGEDWSWSFAFGIPLAILHLGLMWLSSNHACGRIKDRREGLLLPSWSWAGWEGAVHYRLATAHIPEPFNLELADAGSPDRYKVSRSGVIHHIECLTSSPGPPLEGSTKGEGDDRGPKLVAPLQISLNILSFETEATHSRQFSYSPSKVLRAHWDDIDWDLARIVDENMHACGVLFHSGAALRKVSEPNLQFILMGESKSGLFVISLDDTKVEADEDTRENVLGGRYKYSKGRILNIMLINWITEHRAERVTLGQIHVEAWKQASPEMKRIALV